MTVSVYKHLKLKLISIMLGVSLGPFVLLGAAIYYQFGKLYKERMEDQISHLARSQGNAVDVFLKERSTILDLIVDMYSFDELKTQANLLHLFKLINSRTQGLGLVDLGVIDSDGHQLAYAGPYKLEGLNYYQQPWFDEVMRRGRYISDVYMGYRQVPHFIIAAKGNDDNHNWILRATIDSDIFNRLVRIGQVGTSADAYIINRNGIYQTTPRFGGAVLDQSHIETLKFGEGATVLKHKRQDQRTQYIAGAWLKQNDWLLIISQTAGHENSWLIKARNMEALIMSAGCTLIILATILIAHTLVKQLAQSEREMAELNAQLIQQDKLAALGKMAAGIAHEINNPLAVIGEKAGWLKDLLEDEAFTESPNHKEFETAICKIEEHVERSRKITHAMLGFARRMEPRLDDVDVNHVLEQTIDILGNHARINNIDIIKRLDRTIPVLAGDQSQLQQVFMNLINNAVDAIGSDGSIDISTEQKKNQIIVSIRDTGHGIPDHIQKKIFDPFFTTKDAGRGTGLGLSISYKIIKEMGGALSFESSLGKGTTFQVTLPIVLPDKK